MRHLNMGNPGQKKKVLARTAGQVYNGKQIEDFAFCRQLPCPVSRDAAGPKGPERLLRINEHIATSLGKLYVAQVHRSRPTGGHS